MEGRLRDARRPCRCSPSLSLGRNNGWIVHASAARSFAGRAVQIQRLNAPTGQWVTLRKVQLNSKSSARVTLPLPKGVNRLRVTMSVNQAGAGYLGVIGPTVVSALRPEHARAWRVGRQRPVAAAYRSLDRDPVDDVPPCPPGSPGGGSGT